jgi:uncharacterized membrane protein
MSRVPSFKNIKKIAVRQRLERRHFIYGSVLVVIIAAGSVFLIHLGPYKPSLAANAHQVEYVRAKILGVMDDPSTSAGQVVQVKLLDGQKKGQKIIVDRTYLLGDTNSKRLPVGSQVLLTIDPKNGNQYSYLDRYRIPGALTLFLVLLALVLVIGRWRGFMSMVGLILSIGVLSIFILPRIIAGQAAFATCIEGAFIIATTTIYVAHGFNKRTTIALASTLLTLVLIVGLVVTIVYMTGVSGNPGDAVNADEQTTYIQYAPHHIDLGGLLMGGMVIASLGVLEDITTSQVAAVAEIYKANPKQTYSQLYHRGISVGHEHIAALINTLVLVYFGVALPTIVLTVLYNSGPLLVMLNNEPIMEAIARAGATSISLLLAVPLSTALAVYMVPKWSIVDR